MRKTEWDKAQEAEQERERRQEAERQADKHHGWTGPDGEHSVSELASEWQGALSPFGPELPLPRPIESIDYEHPGPEDIPNRTTS